MKISDATQHEFRILEKNIECMYDMYHTVSKVKELF